MRQKLPAIHPRKIQIQQNKVRCDARLGDSRVPVQPCHRLFAVVSDDQFVRKTSFFKGPADEEYVPIVVLREKNPGFSCGTVHFVACPGESDTSTSISITSGQGKTNCNARPGTVLNPDAPAVGLHNFPRNGEAKSSPWHVCALQPPERDKQAIVILGGDSLPVVGNGKTPSFRDTGGADLHDRRR